MNNLTWPPTDVNNYLPPKLDRDLILGIDPGASGGYAWLCARTGAPVEVGAMPETERDIFDVLQEFAPRTLRCYLEKVHSMPPNMPGNTSKNSFTFGQNYGFLRGVVISLGIPLIDVSPQKWKRSLGIQLGADVPKKDKRKLRKMRKNAAKALAQQSFPTVKITHAVSEALLLAHYGRKQET